MAVYSYKTGTISPQIISVQTTEIGNFSSSALFDLVSQNNLFSLNSKTSFSQQSLSFSYNEFSTLYTLSEDYGLLFDGIATINDYANSSIQEYANIEIEDLLSPGSSIDDYGNILNTATLFEDYRSITSDNTPANGRVGKVISATKYSIARVSEIQGTVFLFQGKSNYYINSSYIGYGILSHINGISSEKNTESYVGTGRAFGFGSKAERVVASYNNSSVVSYESLDYASITDGVATIGDYSSASISDYADILLSDLLSPGSSVEDYGSILDDPNLPSERDDYGLITGRGLRPFGLTSFHSSVVEKNTESYVGTGRAFGFDSAKVFVLPIHVGRGVLKIRGEYSNLKNTESYVGTGRAFGFGSKAERTAVSYNLSSIVDYEGLDYASITDGTAIISDYADVPVSAYTDTLIGDLLSPGSSAEDYGSILDDPNLPSERDDYGLITGRGLRPFGLTSFHSSVVEKNTEDYVGSGTLFGFGTAKIFVLPIHYGKGVLKIRGEYSNLKNTESYVGTGRAFGFGSKAERTVVSYNLSSTVDYEGLDYASITDGTAIISDYANEPISTYDDTQIDDLLSPGSSAEDYGSILDDPNLPSERDDYGLITGRGLRPFGVTSFSSAVVEKNTEDYVGSGTLFVFVSKSETNTYVPTSIGLFKFNGSVAENNTESYVGTGRAFGFGSKAERTVVSYNLSSTVDYEGLDYASITDGTAIISDYADAPVSTYIDTLIGDLLSPGSSVEDYGLITDIDLYGQQTDDYGLITGRGLRPFGVTSFSGGYSNLKNTESYAGTGSLFGFSSTTEAFGPKPPASGLFRISGAATQSITPTTEIGSGSIFTFNSSTTILLKANIGTGLFTFSGGYSNLKNTESYAGTGSLFGFSSTTEAFGPKPPASGLFRISGAATQSITPTTEIGSGTVTVSQATQILDADDKTRLVAAYERVSYEEIGEPQAIRISGKVGLYFQFRETGSGTLKVRGRAVIRLKPIHIGGGTYFIRGAAAESTTPATEVGSGSIFTFVSKTETFGANPPENTALFKFSSSPIVKNTESYVGIGLERINVESLILIRPRYPGSGSISISVNGIEKRSHKHIGSGQLFGFGSASEYLTNAYKLDTFVIRIRGSAKDSHSESYSGSGSVFAFVSGAESTGANPPENIALFKFGGNSAARTQPREVGKGRLKFSEGYGRPDQNNKTFIISSDESSSFRTIEEPTQIKVFGFAGTSRPTVYKGKGSLFGFGSKSESAAFSPTETKELFKFTGSSIEKNTESYFGSGSIFSIVGSSYSTVSRPKETTTLFNITGSANEAFAEANYNGSGAIITNLQSKSSTSFRPKSITVLFEFVGSSKERNTEAYNGSGSIGIFVSTAKSVFYDYTVSQKAFRIFGNTFESFAKSNYNGLSYTIITGLSENQKKNYVAPKRTRIFII